MKTRTGNRGTVWQLLQATHTGDIELSHGQECLFSRLVNDGIVEFGSV